MFSKLTLISLVFCALSVNALTIPVARSPSPEPQGGFPRSFSMISYHDLIFVSFTPGGGGSYGSVAIGSSGGGSTGGGYGGGDNGSVNQGYYGGSYGGMGSG